MASLTQMENFEAAINALDKTVAVDTSEGNYIRLCFCRPNNKLARIALSAMLRNLALKYNLHFDGYDEEGYACFINEEN